MKAALLISALLFSLAASAQNHMIEFNADSILLGQYAFSNSKESSKTNKETQYGFVFLNFARTVSTHVQAGIQAQYSKASFSSNTNETMNALVGGIFNFSENVFTNSFYISAYIGMEWDHDYYDNFENDHQEAIVSKLSFGRRFPIGFISENFTYSPEVTFKNLNYTKANSAQWQQDLTFKFLQFSVFF